MGLRSHAAAIGVGYLLARPGTRRRLDQLRREAVDRARPPAHQLRESAWDAAGDVVLATRNAVNRRRRGRGTDAAAVVASSGPEERTTAVGGPRLRDRDSLAAQVAMLHGAGAEPADDFERGAAATLRWLLDGGAGPATGKVNEPSITARSIIGELAAAEAEIGGPRSDRRAFAQGIEHALMWAQNVTSTPPEQGRAEPPITAAPDRRHFSHPNHRKNT